MIQTLTKVLLLMSLLIFFGCGPQGFQSKGGIGLTSDLQSNLGASLPSTLPTPNEDIKGFIASGSNEGQQVVWLDAAKGELIISAPLPAGFSLNLLETPIPSLQEARLYSSVSATGAKTLNLAVPLKHVLRNVASIPAQRLPNGDALPDMPGGELPTYGLSVAGSNGLKANIYVGFDAVGIFFETNFDPKFSVGVDIHNQTQQKVGIFAVIAAKAPFKPGVFLGVHLDARLARALDKFIR